MLLARTAAPAFAAGLHWGAWERALRSGQEAARTGRRGRGTGLFPPRAGHPRALRRAARPGPRRAGGLHRPARRPRRQARHGRGPPGPGPGRRPLGRHAARPASAPTAGEEVPDARHEESASPPGGVPAAFAAARSRPRRPPRPSVTHSGDARRRRRRGPRPGRRSVVNGTRRNLVAAGAGALLAAVLGTVVTLGATSDPDADAGRPGRRQPVGQRRPTTAARRGRPNEPTDAGDTGTATSRPDRPRRPDGVTGTSDDPTPSGSAAEAVRTSRAATRKPSRHPDAAKPTDADPTTPTKPTDKPTEAHRRARPSPTPSRRTRRRRPSRRPRPTRTRPPPTPATPPSSTRDSDRRARPAQPGEPHTGRRSTARRRGGLSVPHARRRAGSDRTRPSLPYSPAGRHCPATGQNSRSLSSSMPRSAL